MKVLREGMPRRLEGIRSESTRLKRELVADKIRADELEAKLEDVDSRLKEVETKP